ncbi:MAG TPA: ABC transporter permease [Trebonia sp.]|nr:ABC transporter permease [Trebonia sp.]
MATMTTSDVKLSALPPTSGQAGLRGVIASEFTKIRSVRSTYWTIAALFIVGVGIAALIGFGIANNIHNQPWNKAGTDGTQSILTPFLFIGQLIIAVIGAMVITSEYSTGMIRTSLTAMPRRGTVYLGKLIVLTVVTLVVSLVTSFIAFFVGSATLSGSGVAGSLFHNVTLPANVNLSPPPGGPGNGPPNYTFVGTDVITSGHVLTAIIGSALFVTVVALIAFGLGAIIRHTAGAISSVFGLMFVLSIIIQVLPDSWRWDIMRFFPDAAGRVISLTVGPDNAHLWSAWPQFLVTVIWAVVLVGVGGYLFRKRDA